MPEELHWLPVKYMLAFKVLHLAFKALSGTCLHQGSTRHTNTRKGSQILKEDLVLSSKIKAG